MTEQEPLPDFAKCPALWDERIRPLVRRMIGLADDAHMPTVVARLEEAEDDIVRLLIYGPDLSLTQQRDALQIEVDRLKARDTTLHADYSALWKKEEDECIEALGRAEQAEAQRDVLKAFIDEHDYAEEFHEWQNR